MIQGIGVDVVDIQRMDKLVQNNKFVERILTLNEQKQFQAYGRKRKVEYLAGRFACKEAYAKAMGTGIGKDVSFQDLEILTNSAGAPYFSQHPQQDKDINVHVSIAHTDLIATAYVILEKK